MEGGEGRENDVNIVFINEFLKNQTKSNIFKKNTLISDTTTKETTLEQMFTLSLGSDIQVSLQLCTFSAEDPTSL